jgi:S-DNA-T family DNA segregation ATPase FtsK/SpoIIIE
MATRSKRTAGAKGRSTQVRKKKPRQTRNLVASLKATKELVRNRLGRQTDDVWGILLIVVAVLTALAFIGLAGPVGEGFTSGLEVLFGIWAWLVPVVVVIVGIAMVGTMPRTDYARLTVGLATIFIGSLAMFHLMTGTWSLAQSVDRVIERGGAVGSLTSFPLRRLIGFWGAMVVLVAVVAIGVLVVTKATVRDVGHTVADAWRWLRHAVWPSAATPEAAPGPTQQRTKPKVQTGPTPSKPEARRKSPPSKPKQAPRPSPKRGDGYALPPVELLDLSESSGHNRRVLEQAGAELEQALHQHGVDARLVRIVPGPTVTRFEIELSPGVKVSRVTGMANDIAYAMASADVRIIAPIPGKSAIGIEVPNRRRELVTLGDILSSSQATADPDPMKIALGKDISGTSRLLKLDELPHVLIAGATGAGKSS